MARRLLCTHWYTNECTKLEPSRPTPLTLLDWTRLYADGASPRVLADRFRSGAAGDARDPAWIKRADDTELLAQIEALEARAAAYPDRAAALRAMPLFGVPYAVKDNIDVGGWPTTAACPAFAHVAAQDSNVVARLAQAGAVCVGKTNLDQFATGLVGTRSPYGRPASTFGAQHISGGSSAGSAVVVSRGDVAFALGTDTAGSGRVPAAFNHIVGLKPTPGRVGTSGVVPACRSLDCVSIFALSVDDAATVLSVIEGDDPADAYSAFSPGRAALPDRLRIGVPTAVTLDAAYEGPWQASLERARALGHMIVPMDFGPLHRTADLLYAGPWVAERHAAVQPLLDSAPEAFDPAVRQVIESARRFSASDAFRGQYALRDAQRDTAALWQTVDVLMVPSAPCHPTFAEVDADPIGANSQLGLYTNFVNLLGWCALAVPSAITAAGLPFGVTFIAPANTDAALVPLGRQWQQATGLRLGATDARLADAAAQPTPACEPTLAIAVVGAHLSGLPLNGQLIERGATLREATHTAPCYRLFALPGTTPPKPGMVRTAQNGAPIAVEVWDMPLRQVGSFLALIPAPLGLGSLELADGRRVHGFVCESHAVDGATDISAFGGWRAYLASLLASAATS
jgi:allophanate hydrolase